MSACVALTMPGGNLVMLYVACEAVTPEVVEAEIAKAGLAPSSWRFVELGEVPTDRMFRAAWRDTGSTLEVDMTIARGIWLEEARRLRSTKFDQLDKDWMRAMGQGDKAEAERVESERQKLRDLPDELLPDVEAARDLVELRAVRLG